MGAEANSSLGVSYSSAELRTGLGSYLGELGKLRQDPAFQDPVAKWILSRTILQARTMLVKLLDESVSSVSLAEVFRTAVDTANSAYQRPVSPRG